MSIFQKLCWKTAKTNVSIGPKVGNFPVIVGKWTEDYIQRTQKSSAELSAAKAGVKADVWPTETLNQFVQKTGLVTFKYMLHNWPFKSLDRGSDGWEG